jgi:hypothetical protein
MIGFFAILLRLFFQTFRSKRTILSENALLKKSSEKRALEDLLLTGKNQVQRIPTGLSHNTCPNFFFTRE